MNSWNMNFCHNLRFLRQEHGLREKDMADILGVSLFTYRRIEKCDETVRLRACDHFCVSADTLLREDLRQS